MKKVEKVAFVFFPIKSVGGIITWNKEMMKGMNYLGVETMYFYATPKVRFDANDALEENKTDYLKLPGYHLSYHDSCIKDTLEILNAFDCVIFTKSSPHPTKENMSQPYINNWKLLYSEVTVPKVVVFHDETWSKQNAWSAEVAPYVDVCLAAQKRFLPSVELYPAKCAKYWDYFPIDFKSINRLDLNKKDNYGMIPTQWIGWKNHKAIMPVLKEIKLPIYFFGVGVELYYIMKTKEYQEAINVDYKISLSKVNKREIADLTPDEVIVRNPAAIHKNFGLVRYEILQEYYAKAQLSVDLSVRGYTNYTHFEPLCYRTLSLIERRVADDPNNVIPHDCFLPYDLPDIKQTLNSITEYTMSPVVEKIRNNGQKFVRGSMNCIDVARRLINQIERI